MAASLHLNWWHLSPAPTLLAAALSCLSTGPRPGMPGAQLLLVHSVQKAEPDSPELGRGLPWLTRALPSWGALGLSLPLVYQPSRGRACLTFSVTSPSSSLELLQRNELPSRFPMAQSHRSHHCHRLDVWFAVSPDLTLPVASQPPQPRCEAGTWEDPSLSHRPRTRFPQEGTS